MGNVVERGLLNNLAVQNNDGGLASVVSVGVLLEGTPQALAVVDQQKIPVDESASTVGQIIDDIASEMLSFAPKSPLAPQ